MFNLIRLAAPPLAAVLGYWLAGLFGSPWPSGKPLPRAPAPAPLGAFGRSWSRGLAQVRQVAPSRSEEAWVLWADEVPEADIAATVAGLDGQRDFVALKMILIRWVFIDPEAALRAWSEKRITPKLLVPMDLGPGENNLSLFGSEPRTEIGRDLLKAWASYQPGEAGRFAREALTRKDTELRAWDLEAVAGPAAGSGRETVRLAEVAKTNPQQAAVEALALPSTQRQAEAGRMVLAEWMKTDPGAAEAWYRSWPQATQSALGTDRLGYPLAGAPADVRARLWGDRLPSDVSVGSLPATTIFGSRLGSEPISETTAALIQWATTDASGARAWVESQTVPAIQTFLTGHLAGALIGRGELTEAVAMVDALPDESKRLALPGLIGGWIKVDAGAAAAWVDQIQDPACRDASLASIASGLGLENPTWALKVAGKISDEKQRDTVTTSVINNVRWSPVTNAQLLRDQGFHPE